MKRFLSVLVLLTLSGSACTVQVDETTGDDGSAPGGGAGCEPAADRFLDLITADESTDVETLRSVAMEAAPCADSAGLVEDFSFGPEKVSDEAASCLAPIAANDTADFMVALYFIAFEEVVPEPELPLVVDALTACVGGSFVLSGIDNRFEDLDAEDKPCLDEEYRRSGSHRPFFQRNLTLQSINTLNWSEQDQFAFYEPIYECIDMTTILWSAEVSAGFSEQTRTCVNGVAADYWYLVLDRTEAENLAFSEALESCMSQAEIDLILSSS